MNKTHQVKVNTAAERWPIAGHFAISRGTKTQADVVVVELSEGKYRGRGECVPYGRYGETVESVLAAIRKVTAAVEDGLDRSGLLGALPAGAARNAIDCALWDLEAKRSGKSASALASLPALQPLTTAYTISIGTAEEMAAAAAAAHARPLLKIKLGGAGDPARITAVRQAAPKAELIVDANEGWTAENLAENFAACAQARVTLIEQPLPANADDALASIVRPVPVCADESVHDIASLNALAGKYDMINVKLDKTGGLTEAFALVAAARKMNFGIMVGSMVATSLSMAPAMLLAQGARVVDLDGPLLLARDRPEGLRYDGSTIYPPEPALWG